MMVFMVVIMKVMWWRWRYDDGVGDEMVVLM